MAEQGFVPAEKLGAVKKNAEKAISVCKEESKRWKNIAEKRLDKLEECHEQLKRQNADKNKKLDETICEKIVSIGTEIAKRV